MADYYLWVNDENCIAWVNVNYEDAEDLFKRFMCEKVNIVAFQDALNLQGIKYDKITFY